MAHSVVATSTANASTTNLVRFMQASAAGVSHRSYRLDPDAPVALAEIAGQADTDRSKQQLALAAQLGLYNAPATNPDKTPASTYL
jgi:hypothetical protein